MPDIQASGLPRWGDIREVGAREGLQLEAPLSFSDKARLITALAGTGVGRIEATAFVSPRAVPSMADAERVGELVRQWPGIEWAALPASPDGGGRAGAGYGVVGCGRETERGAPGGSGGLHVGGVRRLGRQRPQPCQRRQAH